MIINRIKNQLKKVFLQAHFRDWLKIIIDMNYILTVFAFIIFINTAISQTSTNIVTHNKVTIVTNPK